MDVTTLKLSRFGQLCYTGNAMEASYSLSATGTPDDTIYAVAREKEAALGTIDVTMRCPLTPGDVLPQECVCSDPETIQAIEHMEIPPHSASIQVTVGEQFMRLLTEGSWKGIPTLRVGIAALEMGSRELDHKTVWDVSKSRLSEVITVSASFDRSGMTREEMEHVPVDPALALIASTNKHLEHIGKLLAWTLIGAAVIAAAVWART